MKNQQKSFLNLSRSIAIAAFVFVIAISQNVVLGQHDHSKVGITKNGHSKMEPKKNEQSTAIPSIKVKHSLSVTAILDNYLTLKNALVENNSKNAASSGKKLFKSLRKFNLSSQAASKHKELQDILDDAKEHAEHIGNNSGKIDHQREHFEILGTDIKDMIVITGSDRTLYQIYCPMFNNKKGGKWLNESKEVKNPLFGSKMLKCGNIIKEITVK